MKSSSQNDTCIPIPTVHNRQGMEITCVHSQMTVVCACVCVCVCVCARTHVLTMELFSILKEDLAILNKMGELGRH